MFTSGKVFVASGELVAFEEPTLHALSSAKTAKRAVNLSFDFVISIPFSGLSNVSGRQSDLRFLTPAGAYCSRRIEGVVWHFPNSENATEPKRHLSLGSRVLPVLLTLK